MKHIHFIGICGVAMSALAIAFKKAGYTVSGSDVGFYPPVSTMLEKSGVTFYPGWHPEKMFASNPSGELPDLVIVGNVASSTNPEWLAVQEKKIPYQSYPQAIAEFFVKKNSIVCAGTYGKTTTSALLAWIFTQSEFDPSYMFGGLVNPLTTENFPSAQLSNGEWSILEGDEYKSARWDNRPKFAHYKPTHLLLTALSWDHVDVYPTEESYLKVFNTLISTLPKSGLLVACTDIEPIKDIIKKSKCRVVTYGKNSNALYQYNSVIQNKTGLHFLIKYNNTNFQIECPLLGLYQAENITGAFAMATEIGLKTEKIIASLKTFPGIKRRLEKRYEKQITIFDDIAHSPAKAKSVLENLQTIYTKKIIAVFEPNTGNRKPESLSLYKNAFDHANAVIIPRLTKVKVDTNDMAPPIEGDVLAKTIKTTQSNVLYIDDDKKLVEYLVSTAQDGDVIVFLGSHGFRGMIEELISQLK